MLAKSLKNSASTVNTVIFLRIKSLNIRRARKAMTMMWRCSKKE